jgi:hypothetical protein
VIDCALAAARAKFVLAKRLTKTIESSGWSGCRVGLAPTAKAPPYHGARHKRSPISRPVSPISRPVSRTKSNRRKPIASIRYGTYASFMSADADHALFLAPPAANRIAPVTHQDQACRDALRAPWRPVPPQRNVGAKPCPRGCSHSSGCRDGDASPLLAQGLRRFSTLHSIRWHKDDVQSFAWIVHQTAFLAHRLWPNRYAKQRLTSKGFCSRSMW